MIRLKMGREPDVLRNKRKLKLRDAIEAFNQHGHGSKELSDVLKDGYQVAKDTLWSRQHGKCAFCEREENTFNQPVEHFRPKGGASNYTGPLSNYDERQWSASVSSHYWWLAWTWSNLYFSCDDCNRSGAKGNRFPIAQGSVRIPEPVGPIQKIDKIHTSVQSENAILINPREEDPFKHLQWIPANRIMHRRKWTWTIEGRDDRGMLTINALDLKFRIDEVNRHLERMSPTWHEIDDAIAEQRLAAVRRNWVRLVDTFLKNKKQPFRNAVWWALDSLYPRAVRKKYGLYGFDKPTG